MKTKATCVNGYCSNCKGVHTLNHKLKPIDWNTSQLLKKCHYCKTDFVKSYGIKNKHE